MKKQIRRKKPWIFLLSLIILMLVFNFVHEFFGLSYFMWRVFLHAGTAAFIFLIVLYALKLNQKAIRYIWIGGVLWILLQLLLLLSHVFEEYVFFQTNLLVFLGVIAGIFLIMQGFKEAVK